MVVNSSGYPLVPNIVIPEGAKNVSIGKDGLVSYTDGAGVTAGGEQITVTDFINPAGLTPLGDSLFMQSEASGDVIEGDPTTEQFGSLKQSMLESSNVKLVNEMVDLITAQRAYEANSKAITTADNMLDIVNRLKS